MSIDPAAQRRTRQADLTEIRRNRGLSKSKAAEACGISYASYWTAEKGNKVSEATQKRIADWIGMSVTDAFPEEAAA